MFVIVVVVVNHCFTSLFGTNSLLSDIVKRLIRCSQLMRWMMYRWLFEGGGDRAWWVIESVFLRSPNKGCWTCLGDLSLEMPRRPETCVSLCNLMLKLCGISRGSAILGSDSPQRNNSKGNSIHPLWETQYQQHAIATTLPRPTPAPALMRELHWHRSWAEVPGYATGNPPEDYGQIREGCSFPWMIAVD